MGHKHRSNLLTYRYDTTLELEFSAAHVLGTFQTVSDSYPVSDIFEFLWIGNFVGDNLKNEYGNDYITVYNKDFSTSYIPSTSSSSFSIPNNSTYLAADEDSFWFSLASQLRYVTAEELVSYDFSRTIVWYDADSPYNIRAIGILKEGLVLTQDYIDALCEDFHLSVLWNDSYNDYGELKGNRGAERSVWTPV